MAWNLKLGISAWLLRWPIKGKGERLFVVLLIILLLKYFKVNMFISLGKKGHSYEVDVWSLGVIAYALLFGRPPFETNDVKATYEKIKICDYSFPKSNVSQTAKDFISKMLKIVPS
jgi:serine/threonine protein kinase